MSRHKDKKESSDRHTLRILSPEEAKKREAKQWTSLDCSGVGLHSLAPELFRMQFLTGLYLNKNNITSIPSEIQRLSCLEYVDLSNNKLRVLPPEVGNLRKLRELLLYNNSLVHLPYELGRLFLVSTLGLNGNPLSEPLYSLAQEGADTVLTYLLDNSPISAPPPDRTWVQPSRATPPVRPNSAGFTAFCYNVLCDKYATRQMYGYCHSWALNWDYRKERILEEIVRQSADILSLQEVETCEFNDYFQPELQSRGYRGIFRAKSRARNMSKHDQKSVDGCAIFVRNSKFNVISEHLMEFERLAMQLASGSTDMLNRVMNKDNIALALVLEHTQTRKQLLVTNAHLTWSPQFEDVKIIQMMMLMYRLREIRTGQKDEELPVLLMGDLNSLPDSGVFEYVDKGEISPRHPVFHGRDYTTFFEKVGMKHPFRLRSAYTNELPYTNYTHDFTGIIDYIWYPTSTLAPTALLGPVEPTYMKSFAGCPNPHFPSDHLALAAELSFL